MKGYFIVLYLFVMMIVVMAVESVNLCCKLATDKRPIKWFDL